MGAELVWITCGAPASPTWKTEHDDGAGEKSRTSGRSRKEVGLDGLQLDENGACTLVFDGRAGEQRDHGGRRGPARRRRRARRPWEALAPGGESARARSDATLSLSRDQVKCCRRKPRQPERRSTVARGAGRTANSRLPASHRRRSAEAPEDEGLLSSNRGLAMLPTIERIARLPPAAHTS